MKLQFLLTEGRRMELGPKVGAEYWTAQRPRERPRDRFPDLDGGTAKWRGRNNGSGQGATGRSVQAPAVQDPNATRNDRVVLLIVSPCWVVPVEPSRPVPASPTWNAAVVRPSPEFRVRCPNGATCRRQLGWGVPKHSRSVSAVPREAGVRVFVLAAALLGILPNVARAQVVWVAEPKSSLAWWQVSPHYNQLWATTCPNDASWQPGEGHSAGWSMKPALPIPRTGQGSLHDTIQVPYYPRGKVRPVCPEAVQGRVVLPDTATWRGAHGEVTVIADALISGENMRDGFAKKLMHTSVNPLIKFKIDSLVDMKRHGDSLVGRAMGVLTVNGHDKALSGAVRAKPDAGGTRVFAKLHIPASVLFEDYKISKYLLMGAGTGIWRDLFMGVDLVMRPEVPTAKSLPAFVWLL